MKNLSIAVLFALLLTGDVAGQEFGPWSPPVNLGPTVNSTCHDQQPGLSKDGLNLISSSSRPCPTPAAAQSLTLRDNRPPELPFQLSSGYPVDVKTLVELNDSSSKLYLVNFLSQADTSAPGYDIALAWARSAASENEPSARFLFGYLYEHGHGVPRDYAKAAENYEAAAVQGYALAQNNLAGLYGHGLGVRKDMMRAFRLFLAAAQQGNRVAQWNLGHAYYEGYGTPRDLAQAARWFRAAAELGDPFAQYDLAALYFRGLGVRVDYAESARWERLAAQQGYAAAETSLGYLYETGKGVPLNYVAAYAWYSRASAAGDDLASKRRKSLSRLMTPKQLVEASSVVGVAPR